MDVSLIFLSIGPLHWVLFQCCRSSKKKKLNKLHHGYCFFSFLLINHKAAFIYVFLMQDLTHLKKSDKYFQIKH